MVTAPQTATLTNRAIGLEAKKTGMVMITTIASIAPGAALCSLVPQPGHTKLRRTSLQPRLAWHLGQGGGENGRAMLQPNVHNEGRAACGPSLSIVGLGIAAQTAEEVSLAKAALSSLAP